MKKLLWAVLAALASPTFALSNFALQVSAPSFIVAGKEVAPIQVKGPDNPHAKTHVLDQRGRRIAQLKKLGDDLYSWDGRDASGQAVRPGTYLIEIVEEPYLWSGAISVIR